MVSKMRRQAIDSWLYSACSMPLSTWLVLVGSRPYDKAFCNMFVEPVGLALFTSAALWVYMQGRRRLHGHGTAQIYLALSGGALLGACVYVLVPPLG